MASSLNLVQILLYSAASPLRTMWFANTSGVVRKDARDPVAVRGTTGSPEASMCFMMEKPPDWTLDFIVQAVARRWIDFTSSSGRSTNAWPAAFRALRHHSLHASLCQRVSDSVSS
jgi:hypothetical protein